MQKHTRAPWRGALLARPPTHPPSSPASSTLNLAGPREHISESPSSQSTAAHKQGDRGAALCGGGPRYWLALRCGMVLPPCRSKQDALHGARGTPEMFTDARGRRSHWTIQWATQPEQSAHCDSHQRGLQKNDLLGIYFAALKSQSSVGKRCLV